MRMSTSDKFLWGIRILVLAGLGALILTA